jgi:hypothetical protein
MGTFTFATAETFRFDKPPEEALMSERVFTELDYTIDWLLEETTIISSVNNHASSIGPGSLRMLALLGAQSFWLSSALLSLLQIIQKKSYLAIKNTILLKLRI